MPPKSSNMVLSHGLRAHFAESADLVPLLTGPLMSCPFEALRWPKMAPESQMTPRWPQDGPKMAPRWPQDGLGWPKIAPKMASESPNMASESPKITRRLPRMPLDSPEMPEDSHKMAQSGPKIAQDWPEWPLDCLKWPRNASRWLSRSQTWATKPPTLPPNIGKHGVSTREKAVWKSIAVSIETQYGSYSDHLCKPQAEQKHREGAAVIPGGIVNE